MSLNRYAKRVDANQAQIVSALESAGAKVLVIGQPVDLLVGVPGTKLLMLIEVKNPSSAYGKRGANRKQEEFFEQWGHYPLAMVDSPESALAALNVLRRSA